MSEHEAIERLRQGDIDGLEELVLRYQLPAIRASYLISRDRALAEDLVQSAFLRAFERIAQYDSARPFGPWFLRSVVNDTLKAVTRRTRLVPLEAEVLECLGSLSERHAELEERLEHLDTQEALSTAIAQLAPEQRAVIVMRYYLGMTGAEISSKMHSTPGMVRWRLHGARQRLRDLLPFWVRPSTETYTAREARPPSPSYAAQIEKGDV